MDFYEIVRTRRSVRKYKPTPVEKDKLDRIWEAVRQAPSACNMQPWRFLLVRSREMRQKLSPILQPWAASAPELIVALGNRTTAWQRDGESIHCVDVAIAFEHLVLAAASEGLGTCWICAFNRKNASQALQLPPEWEPVAITPLGYADDSNVQPDRKSIEEIVEVI
jgi:nitroreductase